MEPFPWTVLDDLRVYVALPAGSVPSGRLISGQVIELRCPTPRIISAGAEVEISFETCISATSEVILADSTFIVESQFSDPGDEGNWSVSRLTFAEISRGDQPFTQRAPFGVGKQPHRWRIWTLVPSGAVSVSSWRTVLFSN